MHDCASIIDSIALKTSSHWFTHVASLHQYSFICTLIFVKLARIHVYMQLHTSTVPCHHMMSTLKMTSCLVAGRIRCSVTGFVVTA